MDAAILKVVDPTDPPEPPAPVNVGPEARHVDQQSACPRCGVGHEIDLAGHTTVSTWFWCGACGYVWRMPKKGGQ